MRSETPETGARFFEKDDPRRPEQNGEGYGLEPTGAFLGASDGCYAPGVSPRSEKSRADNGPPSRSSLAFLLSQLGAHVAAKFAERVGKVGLAPPHVGILLRLAGSEGLTQGALCETLAVVPSRVVALVDELEALGLVERRSSPNDRRAYALHITKKGRAKVDVVVQVASEHEEALFRALNAQDRKQLSGLLRRVADEQGLRPGVHPGFARFDRKRPK
jgi:DNA-binding MarR family transcriptional regulator